MIHALPARWVRGGRLFLSFFFCTHTATPGISLLSLPAALPIPSEPTLETVLLSLCTSAAAATRPRCQDGSHCESCCERERLSNPDTNVPRTASGLCNSRHLVA